MQQLFNKQNSTWQPLSFFSASIVLLFCLCLWFVPYSHPWCEQLDKQFFFTINKTLAWSAPWSQICGWLNHPNETWLNLIVMVGINFLAIACLKKEQRPKALLFTIYCWFFFQLGLCVSHAIFRDLLSIKRASPSMVLSPIIRLSGLVSHPVRDCSANSFPAGHAFVLFYWAGFTARYATRSFTYLAYFIVILLVFPRLISGGHWLSDIIFTMAVSYAWLAVAIDTPLFNYLDQRLKKWT